MKKAHLLAALCAAAVLIEPAAGYAASCPAILNSAERLAVVLAEGMDSNRAWLSLYRRARGSREWQRFGGSEPVLLGRNGLAWGPGFQHLARAGEARKRESDWRSPLGVYRLGAPFGFDASRLANYVRIVPGRTICVDDPKSPAYNTITTVDRVGSRVSAERMWDYPQYRRGLFIRYPSSHAHPADSCIFIHIATTPDETTAGCLALPEARVIELQNFGAPRTAIAIVSRDTRGRFGDCLPGFE